MCKGLIIIGYQGIGKSSCASAFTSCIDLESSAFYIGNKRQTLWYIPYCQIAMNLANQGYTVFVSSHKEVRGMLSTMPLLPNVGKVVVFCPNRSMKDAWIERLRKRYEETGLDKDYRALKGAESFFDANIIDLVNCGLPVYQPSAMDYDLMNYVNKMLSDWCVFNIEKEAGDAKDGSDKAD